MHIHLAGFQLLDRQDFSFDTGGNLVLSGSPVTPKSASRYALAMPPTRTPLWWAGWE
jgi:hypothetical protein